MCRADLKQAVPLGQLQQLIELSHWIGMIVKATYTHFCICNFSIVQYVDVLAFVANTFNVASLYRSG